MDSIVLSAFSLIVVVLALVLLLWEPADPPKTVPVKMSPKGKPAATRSAPAPTATPR